MLVEFLVAFMPLMITFSSFVQLAQITTARIVTKHSAIVAARAAAVISNEHNNTPDAKKGKNQDEIEASVQAALGPWGKTMTNVKVEIDDQSSADDNFGMVKVTVTARYRCSVPFGGMLVCGTNGGVHEIRAEGRVPSSRRLLRRPEGAEDAENDGDDASHRVLIRAERAPSWRQRSASSTATSAAPSC